MAASTVYSSQTFQIIVGEENKGILVHKEILVRSPVFRAMTETPFQEREEQKIELPDDSPDHFRCLVEFLYTSDFAMDSEAWLEDSNEEDTSMNGNDIARASRRGETAAEHNGSIDGSYHEQSGDESLRGKEIIASDLAQIYVLAEKYQLPELKTLTLEKLGKLVTMTGFPVLFLRLVSVFSDYVSETDEELRAFVQNGLSGPIVNIAPEHKAEAIDSIIECGYMNQGGVLAEDILRAFAAPDYFHSAVPHDTWRFLDPAR